MPGFKVWDVIKVPFPYTNRPVRQHRPALVIRTIRKKDAPELLWVLMITSASHRQWDGDIVIADFKAAGLPTPSMIRTAKIATIEASDAETIGALPTAYRNAVLDIITEAVITLRETFS